MSSSKRSYVAILPVLFLEYLAISLARTLFPQMIVDGFGDKSYIAVGVCETVKGLLAFVSCPLFGKLSDKIGRKPCLLLTMVGSTLPVWFMAIVPSIFVYMTTLAFSGIFSATFSLTFAYISDCVEGSKRAPAFGMALATFGLSFTIGPLLGSYLAQLFGTHLVFTISAFLCLLNFLYIMFILPETADSNQGEYRLVTGTYAQLNTALESIPIAWQFSETFKVFRSDKFMSNLALIVLLYYTAVWSLVSTLMVFVTRNLHLSPVYLAWLLSSYGLATMISESVLVRVIVPQIGEVNSIRLGLVAFALQCFTVAYSNDLRWIFLSVIFSMISNLVYPAVSSLVSRIMAEDRQGEALGALNGIKAATEGVGPLVFGILMALFETTPQPGAPYLMAGMLSLWAFLHCFEISDSEYRFEKFFSLETYPSE